MRHWIKALGMLGGVALMSVSAHAQLARVTGVERLAEKRVGAVSWQKAARGATLGVGDGLRTGRRSKADLKFADGSLLRLGQLSTVELKSTKGASLTGGSLLFSMLKPGRVIAGTAAAEIKGSVGIISISDNGNAEFTLFSGAMDVVTARATVQIPPGQAVTVFSDGSLSPVRPAPPLYFAAETTGSSLLDAPSESPFMGSRADLRARFTPDRLALDSAATLVKQTSASPFTRPVIAPVPTPTTAPNPLPTTAPAPTPTTAPQPTPKPDDEDDDDNPGPDDDRNPPVDGNENTDPIPTPVPVPNGGDDDDKGGGKDKDKDDNPNDGNNGGGNDDKNDRQKSARVQTASNDLNNDLNAPESAKVGAVATSFPSGGINRRFVSTSASELPRLAMAAPEKVPVRVAGVVIAPPTIPPGTTAEEHILQSNLGLGRSFSADATSVALFGEGGARVVGGRLRATATRARLSAEVALSPSDARFGGNSQRRYTLSDASLTLRLARGDLQVGRQRFLSGPTLVTGMGSMVRQGGRQIMDAVTFRPALSKGNYLEVAYLNDAFVRDLPFRVGGQQRGFYGRFGLERRAGNFGLNVLHLSGVPTGSETGVTFDFALPVVRDNIEFYGEIGRDPFRRNLRTFGLGFPGLQTRTGIELYLEHSALQGRQGLLDAPHELAILAYKPLRAGVSLTGGFSHFSDGRNLATFGLAFGTRP